MKLELWLGMTTKRFPAPVSAQTPRRSSERRQVTLPARLTWKDATGAIRFTSVTTRDVSEAGVWVDADCAASIPLYRIVHVQLETGANDPNLPARLREGRVRSAVWRVGACKKSKGTPEGYALRFLVDPAETSTRAALAS